MLSLKKVFGIWKRRPQKKRNGVIMKQSLSVQVSKGQDFAATTKHLTLMVGKSVWTPSWLLLLVNPLTVYPIAYNPLLKENIATWAKVRMTTFFITQTHHSPSPNCSNFIFFLQCEWFSSTTFLTSHIQLTRKPMKGLPSPRTFMKWRSPVPFFLLCLRERQTLPGRQHS